MIENVFKLYYTDKIDLFSKIIESSIFESIFLSIIAAVIFNHIFVTIPFNKRKNKLRPIIETDMGSIYFNLTITFDLIFRHYEKSPSYYQDKMRGNQLSKKDFNIALQNKVSNNNFLLDKNLAP